MAPASQTSLGKLFRRLVLAFFAFLVGSWGLIVPRLNLFRRHWPYEIQAEYLLYADAAAMALALIGLLAFVFNARALGWRLRRLDDLGEANW
ncbi:MAG: hypothetical protein LBP92_14530 [Deltaproteobacteria bacterium]|jgi:hypothetical protein|nr:hypothetical protein [Deltaproteobacteria bacterium]